LKLPGVPCQERRRGRNVRAVLSDSNPGGQSQKDVEAIGGWSNRSCDLGHTSRPAPLRSLKTRTKVPKRRLSTFGASPWRVAKPACAPCRKIGRASCRERV